MDTLASKINDIIGGKGRNAVSKDKYRFQDGTFDLDLTYITPRIIAMGLPGKKIEKVWRNDIDEVVRFFDHYHRNHFLIINLSGERYDYSMFDNRVRDFGFPDHGTCPLLFLGEICKCMHEHLNQDKENVVAVHCLAGRGRTGTIIAAYLLHCGMITEARDALRYFANQRSRKGEGVLTPSQIRYVGYYQQILQGQHTLVNKKLLLEKIVMSPCLNVPTVKGWTPILMVYRLGTTDDPAVMLWSGNTPEAPTYKVNRTNEIVYTLDPAGCCVEGDIQLKFYHRAKSVVSHANILQAGGGLKAVEKALSLQTYPLICVFRVTFHTSFIPKNNVLKFTKSDLDAMFSGQAHTTMIPDNFTITIHFSPVSPSSSSSASTTVSTSAMHPQSGSGEPAPAYGMCLGQLAVPQPTQSFVPQPASPQLGVMPPRQFASSPNLASHLGLSVGNTPLPAPSSSNPSVPVYNPVLSSSAPVSVMRPSPVPMPLSPQLSHHQSFFVAPPTLSSGDMLLPPTVLPSPSLSRVPPITGPPPLQPLAFPEPSTPTPTLVPPPSTATPSTIPPSNIQPLFFPAPYSGN